MLDVSIEEIEKLMFLMGKYKVDKLALGNMELIKTQHTYDEQPQTKQQKIDDEALLFYSSDT